MAQLEERRDIFSTVKKTLGMGFKYLSDCFQRLKESVIILEILSEQRSAILTILLGISNPHS